MEVYRIAKKKYLNDISGFGAKLYGGRWNREGLQMLYTSAHLSLAVLEVLANQFRKKIDHRFGYITLNIPDKAILDLSDIGKLSENWRASQYSQQTIDFGSDWLLSQQSLALKVPSAVLEQESNILINPFHKDFNKLTVKNTAEVNLDGRVATK
jgi:RES domain-containing protein